MILYAANNSPDGNVGSSLVRPDIECRDPLEKFGGIKTLVSSDYAKSLMKLVIASICGDRYRLRVGGSEEGDEP